MTPNLILKILFFRFSKRIYWQKSNENTKNKLYIMTMKLHITLMLSTDTKKLSNDTSCWKVNMKLHSVNTMVMRNKKFTINEMGKTIKLSNHHQHTFLCSNSTLPPLFFIIILLDYAAINNLHHRNIFCF